MPNDGQLTFEDGQVWLGKELLPGILVQQSIRGAVRYDQSHHDQQSGKKKAVLGWEDAQITLTLDLLSGIEEVDGKRVESTCYEKLTIINKIFKHAEKGKSVPKVYEVTGRHLCARGIRKVVFDALDSWETDEDDTIQVTLTFTEHLPPIVKREERNAAKKTGTAPATKAKPATSASIVKDDNPLIAGFKAGMK